MSVGQNAFASSYEATGCAAVLPLSLPGQGKVGLRMYTEDLQTQLAIITDHVMNCSLHCNNLWIYIYVTQLQVIYYISTSCGLVFARIVHTKGSGQTHILQRLYLEECTMWVKELP